MPASDEPAEVAPGRWVAKDLSGLPDAVSREAALRSLLGTTGDAQVLVCANEGVLRDAVDALGQCHPADALEPALRRGASGPHATRRAWP